MAYMTEKELNEYVINSMLTKVWETEDGYKRVYEDKYWTFSCIYREEAGAFTVRGKEKRR